MGAELSADLRRAAGLARLAVSDLGSQAALALEALARTQNLVALAVEEPEGLPLLGEDPFGALAGASSGGASGRASAALRAGPAPAGGQLLSRTVSTPERRPRPAESGAASTAAEALRGAAKASPLPAAAGSGAGARITAPGSGAEVSGRLLEGSADSVGLLGAGLARLTETVAGATRPEPAESAVFEAPEPGGSPTTARPRAGRGAESADASAVASRRRGTASGVATSSGAREPGPAPLPRGEARQAGAEAQGSPEDSGGRGGAEAGLRPGRPGGVWDQLAELAEDALRRGWSPAGQTAPGSAGDAPGGGDSTAPLAGGSVESPTGAPTRQARELAAAQAARARAAGLLDRVKASAARAVPQGESVAAAPRAAPLDPDELAELVNDALVRQARRHGVDLS